MERGRRYSSKVGGILDRIVSWFKDMGRTRSYEYADGHDRFTIRMFIEYALMPKVSPCVLSDPDVKKPQWL